MNTSRFFASEWVLNPLAIAVVAAGLFVYFRRFGWSAHGWWMLAAATVFLLTLDSPLAVLAQGYLFSAHMAQHILLLLVVPAFALMALPPARHMPPVISRLLNPAVCWGCGVGAMWVWHVPALCDAAAISRSVSAVQTATLLVLGAAFWWQVLAPVESQRISPLHGVLYLFAACVACSVLGIILTFSPVTVCKAYLHPVDRLGIDPLIRGEWGMTAGRDQQIGGLLMWVPMCMIYLTAIFGQVARWYAAPAEVPIAIS
ncbi:MAG: cytochrome c oxidase assembly protein [Chthoniobacteraceae bacterium]|jgi:cytochrome c oxidase assembly factor CtaG